MAFVWGVSAQAADATDPSATYPSDSDTPPSATFPPDDRPVVLDNPTAPPSASRTSHLAAPSDTPGTSGALATSMSGSAAINGEAANGQATNGQSANGSGSGPATSTSGAQSSASETSGETNFPGAYAEIPLDARGPAGGTGGGSDVGETPRFGYNGSSYGGCGAAIGAPSTLDISRDPAASVLQRPAAPAGAQSRYLQASVGGSETYSDNITLAPPGQARSDFVSAIVPSIDGCSTEGRIRGSFTYDLQGVVYANNPQYNNVYNDVAGQTTIDVLKNHLYLDADTSYGQQVIDPAFGYADSNIVRPNQNQTTAWLTNISPYLLQNLGGLGEGELRYRYGRSVYDGDVVPDTTVQSVFASIVSPQSVAPLSWQIAASTQHETTDASDIARFPDELTDAFPGLAARQNALDEARSNYFDSASLQLGYQIAPDLQTTATGGVEDRYRQDGANDRFSAPLWRVGVHYASAASSADFSYGHRFYGADYGLNISHKVRDFRFNLSYQENLSTPGLESLDDNTDDNLFGSIGSISDQLGPGYGRGFGTDGSLLDRGVYVDKRWDAGVHWQTALADSDLQAFWNEQSSVGDDVPSTHYYGVEVDSRYALRPRVSVVPSFSWTRYHGGIFDTGASNTFEANVSIVRALSRTLNAALGYGRSWRTGAGDEYTENSVTLQIQKSF